jgi:hypothetical protein
MLFEDGIKIPVRLFRQQDFDSSNGSTKESKNYDEWGQGKKDSR